LDLELDLGLRLQNRLPQIEVVMEYYESKCPHCRHVWRWVGYKAGWTAEHREYNRKKGSECPRCGKDKGKTALDHSSPAAKALDSAMSDTVKKIVKPVDD